MVLIDCSFVGYKLRVLVAERCLVGILLPGQVHSLVEHRQSDPRRHIEWTQARGLESPVFSC